MTKTSRLVIIDDHPIVREGLRSLLAASTQYDVVGDAAGIEEGLRLLAKHDPHLVLLDVSLSGKDALDEMKRIKGAAPRASVVVFSMHDDALTVDRALRSGARGYVLKGSGMESLKTALASVLRGEVYLSPGISEYVLQGFLASPPLADEGLSPRECEVLRFIAEGFTSREIAEKLELSPKTVENHRARVMEKLDIHTTAGLVRYAVRMGLVA